ncbi:MAG TPA: MFS transporter [Hyphomonadaceae bacterium]|jgi:predicted MFS family arabinose efflux permease|nr:MFS transporter [Hyphomonadaceae bacterium]
MASNDPSPAGPAAVRALEAKSVTDPVAHFFARLGIHYAWVVAAVTFLTALVSAGALGSVGVLLLPVEIEFGWTPAEVSSALGLRLALFGLTAPFAAALFNRFGLRPVILVSLAMITAGMGLSVFVKEIWHLVALWGVVVGIGAGLTAIVLSATVATRWFEKRRGLVVGMLAASTATGQLVVLPALAWVVDRTGWRAAILVMCGLYALASVLVIIFIRNCPSDVGLKPFGADDAFQPQPAPTGNLFAMPFAALGEAVRKPMFWVLAGAFFICGASTNGLVQMHLIPMCADYSITATSAAGLLALMGIFDFFGTIASGWLSDRFNSRVLLFWYYGLRGLSLLYLPFSNFGSVELAVFAVFYGLDWIATVPPTVKLTAQTFGPARANLVFGWIFAAHQLGAGFAALMAGIIRTELGSYSLAFQGAGLLCVVAALAVLASNGRKREPVTAAA